MTDEGHLELTRREFALQSSAMAQGATFNAEAAVQPFVAGLRESADAALPSPVLDLACGPGIVTAALAAAGAEVTGFDATPEMLALARRRCAEQGTEGVHFEAGDARNLPFEAAHFSAATTRLSVHHFPEPAAILAELRRVLRPGAALVLGDIVASENPADARLHNAIEKLRDPSHVRLLGEAELVGVVQSAGFQVEACEPWENPKRFSEWAAVVGEARDLAPVREVMTALARAGRHGGFDLHLKDGEPCFVHHWRFLRARAR